MKNSPTILSLRNVYDMCVNSHSPLNKGACQVEIEGQWVPARGLGFFGIRNRIKAAWLVFTGQADALVWPEDNPKFNGIEPK